MSPWQELIRSFRVSLSSITPTVRNAHKLSDAETFVGERLAGSGRMMGAETAGWKVFGARPSLPKQLSQVYEGARFF
jgi:hypothetical protein